MGLLLEWYRSLREQSVWYLGNEILNHIDSRKLDKKKELGESKVADAKSIIKSLTWVSVESKDREMFLSKMAGNDNNTDNLKKRWSDLKSKCTSVGIDYQTYMPRSIYGDYIGTPEQVSSILDQIESDIKNKASLKEKISQLDKKYA